MNEIHVLKEFQATLDQLVEADEFSGAVLVARDQTILFQQAYGMANQSDQIPNRIDTRFNLASMNKMFTAVAVVQLAEQGKLAFGDPVSAYLLEYPREIAEKVTIHHLLTHTSGLGWLWTKHFWNERFVEVRAHLRTVNDFLPLFRDEPLTFEPGEKFQYSNAGFVVLGSIIEHVSGQDYFTYVREHIYEPAGMHNTDAYDLDRSLPNQAIGYTHLNRNLEREAGPRRSNLFQWVVKGGPSGGGFSTVEDLFNFSLAIRSYQLLSPTFTTLLLTEKVERSDQSDAMYAYGWNNRTVNGHGIVGHSGGAWGISTHFDLYLDLGYTVVVLANYDAPIAHRIADDLQKQLTS
ncbi:MAG: beta-lactamase family protein [Chloroflexota bacterium]|nr:beta-lactamase family protein [Chloroflexota bacterium]